MPRSPDDAVQFGSRQAQGIVVVPVDVDLIPGRARVFNTLRSQMIRSNQGSRVEDAVRWRRIIGIAARDGWRSSTRVELGQAIKGLIGITVLRPIFSQRAKVVIERSILLRHENDV